MDKNLHAIALILLLILASCRNDGVKIQGSLPIDSLTEVKLVNIMTGKELLVDTVVPSDFSLNAQHVQQGIYLLEFSWNRHQLKPQEIKERSQFQTQVTPKHVLSKAIWLDHKSKQQIKLGTSDNLSQEDLEIHLLNENGEFGLIAESDRENAQLFEKFLQIGTGYSKLNRESKEKIKAKQYAANDSGDFEQSKVLQKQLEQSWDPVVKATMLHAEVDFLKKQLHRPFVPYILYARIGSKDDFKIYQSIYEGLDEDVKEKIGVWFEKYM
ncbi:hypothetical protein ACFSQ3_01410 [Sphingobacterium corticis]|uniref:DUF4369 domain-containing protein n=1 Tax=Sphingobacterium corticis TaxID=1812823 RepID=A0ABW5NI74_9SPHI